MRRSNSAYYSVDQIETIQLLSYGHVMRMEDKRFPKKALNYTANTRRTRGTPTITWQDSVSRTMRDIVIIEGNWRDKKTRYQNTLAYLFLFLQDEKSIIKIVERIQLFIRV